MIRIRREARTILDQTIVDAPPHESGLLPAWLQEKGADVILAGGMGSRARDLFQEKRIRVIVAAPPEVAYKVVSDYLSGTRNITQSSIVKNNGYTTVMAAVVFAY